MSNNNTQTKPGIRLAQPLAFDGTCETKHVSTNTLCKYVNELFRGVFKDYLGCKITPNITNPMPGDTVTVDLFFVPNSDNGKGAKTRAFCPIGDAEVANASNDNQVSPKNNYVAAILKHNTRVNTSGTMQITPEAVELLYPLIQWKYKGKLKESAKSFTALGLAVETCVPSQYGVTTPIIHNMIRGIDLDAIMKIIFGQDNAYEFAVSPIRPMLPWANGMNVPVTPSWLFAISKLSKSEVQDLANELGYNSKISDLDINTSGLD